MEGNLYLKIPFYDIFVHMLGGLGIGFFISGLINSFKPDVSRRKLIIITGTLIFGIVWELFEIRYNLAGHPFGTNAYYLDTLKDIIDDVVGGTLVALLWRSKIQRLKIKH